ncbi:hypothetical protein diail_7378 [Diaporthe ilicicola]|nr:hypothetical protein diail_7378 [Diaporthe ilicicola]
MGSWDCYCAICGGPFWGVKVSQKPRTPGFRRRKAKEIENRRQGRETYRKDMISVEEQDEDDESDSHESYDEAQSYDPDVVSEDDAKWTETLHVLAFNSESEQAFVSGPGNYNDYGSVSVEEGDDPNALGSDLDSMFCYSRFDSEPIFPFHWCCYEILAKFLTGSFDDGKLDKNLLFSVMEELATDHSCSLWVLDYDIVGHMQGQWWENHAGFELLVSPPRGMPGVSEVILSMFETGALKPMSGKIDLGGRVRKDLFAKTSYDIIHRICIFASDADLANLGRASWPVHLLLRNNNQFWRQRLWSSLPWFFELQELLEQDDTLLQTNDGQRVFQWAERVTRPEKWLTGPLMSVANRRRIWSVCEQLGEIYWLREEEQNDPDMSDVLNHPCGTFQ